MRLRILLKGFTPKNCGLFTFISTVGLPILQEDFKRWRLLDLEFPEDPWLNMAVEEAISLHVGEGNVSPTFRFWRNENTVVIGYFQSIRDVVNIPFVKKLGVAVVRRFSGGGAVYQDLGNLNFAFSIPRNSGLIPVDVLKSYEKFCSGVISGLKKIGFKARFKPINDIIIGDKKVSGNAQARQKGYVLHHGTLMVDTNLDMLAALRGLRTPVTTLTREKGAEGQGLSLDLVKKMLCEGIEETLKISLEPGKLIRGEMETAKKLLEEKYGKEEFIFLR